MRVWAMTTACPVCGHVAMATLYEETELRSGAEGYRVDFRCEDRTHTPDEPQMLKLWAAVRGDRALAPA